MERIDCIERYGVVVLLTYNNNVYNRHYSILCTSWPEPKIRFFIKVKYITFTSQKKTHNQMQWTDEKTNRLIYLRVEEEMPYAKLAKTFECSKDACRNRFNRTFHENPLKEWFESEVTRLQTAMEQIEEDADELDFQHVSRFVRTKSARECRLKWLTISKNQNKRYTEMEKSDAHLLSRNAFFKKYPLRGSRAWCFLTKQTESVEKEVKRGARMNEEEKKDAMEFNKEEWLRRHPARTANSWRHARSSRSGKQQNESDDSDNPRPEARKKSRY